MFDVALNWDACPDGVEIHEYGPTEDGAPKEQPVGLLGGLLGALTPSGPQFRTRTDRRIPVRIESVDLMEPLVLRFMNLKNTTAIANFFGRFGMPTQRDHAGVDRVLHFKQQVTGYVEFCMSYPPGEKASVVNDTLFDGLMLRPEYDFLDKAQKGRVALYAPTMVQFMNAEVAVAVLNDVSLTRCANCNDAFFTGPAAHRRSDTKTCSVKCRVAFNTAKKKAETAPISPA